MAKIVNGQKTTYITIGDVLVQEKNDDYELNYDYDSSGAMKSFGHKAAGSNTETFFFVARDLQGDIIAVFNSEDSSADRTRRVYRNYNDERGFHPYLYSQLAARWR